MGPLYTIAAIDGANGGSLIHNSDSSQVYLLFRTPCRNPIHVENAASSAQTPWTSRNPLPTDSKRSILPARLISKFRIIQDTSPVHVAGNVLLEIADSAAGRLDAPEGMMVPEGARRVSTSNPPYQTHLTVT